MVKESFENLPPALRLLLGKFVFFNWPPSLHEMKDNVQKYALRLKLTTNELDKCIVYLNGVLEYDPSSSLNEFWNSLDTQLRVTGGEGGRPILMAINDGLKSARLNARPSEN